MSTAPHLLDCMKLQPEPSGTLAPEPTETLGRVPPPAWLRRSVPEPCPTAGAQARETQVRGYEREADSNSLLYSSDCPSNGLCCFDGCADTCVDGPKPTPPPYVPEPLPVEPVEAETEEKPQEIPSPTPSTEGYNYPVPEFPLELPKPSSPPPDLPTLYGAPPI